MSDNDVFSDPMNEEEEEENEQAPAAEASGKARQADYDDDEDEEEEDEEDDEEDDEEEDEEVEGQPQRKRQKLRRKKRSAASRFIDLEAEVEEDEEDEDEDEEFAGDDFIATHAEGDDDVQSRRVHNSFLDRDQNMNEKDLEELAENLTKRYGRPTVRYTGDMNEIPQRLLMPSVHDASLWQVRVKPGRERDIVFSLMRKSVDVEFTAKPLQILSAFQRDTLPGMIYVEARSAKQVSEAVNGLVGVFPSRGITLVPIEEMASLLQIKKQDTTVAIGSWVRIKRGKYAGDLAQVIDHSENGEDVGLKFVPRIDLNPREETSLDAKKRKKGVVVTGNARPPQRLFNFEEVVKVWGRKHVSKRNQVYVFQGETYKDGFMEKDFKISALQLDDVHPTLDEITQFTRGADGMDDEQTVDLSVIAEASRKAAIAVLQPGDQVEVFEGEQAGVKGVVEEVSQDVVTITAIDADLQGQKVDIPARSVRKRFKPGDHVKVMAGQNADETGLVVAVADNIVTFLSDMSLQEVSVFSKDLREAAEVGSGTNIVGDYELHDMVQLDLQTVGVIFKTERDSFRVLDQHGQVRLVKPHQISMRRDSNRAIATDAEGHEVRINDNMRETDGEGRKGRVLHIHQSFYVFLFNREINENGGVFVTRTRSLVSLAPKSMIKTAGLDLTKMNPAMAAPVGGMVGSGAMGRGPRDRTVGMTVVITKGPQKGYVGLIRDTNGPIARVELATNNKIISIEKSKLKERKPDGKTYPLEGAGSWFHSQRGDSGNSRNPNHSSMGPPPPDRGGKTPAWGTSGRTPNPYAGAGGRTPAWNSGKTPNPYADGAGGGGKTPAWNAMARTPNPYAAGGGRTPAWNASKTPNPYLQDSGNSWGGATPGRSTNPSSSAWGGATPGRTASSSSWGDQSNSWDSSGGWGGAASAPTPAPSAPTPAASAPTPFNAPTPFAYATPHVPSGVSAAPTPGFANTGYDIMQEPEMFELAENWLTDPALKEVLRQTYVLVRVKGTRDDGYADGVHENKEGRVTLVMDTGAGGVVDSAATATVQFDGGQSELSIPIKYLEPINPDNRPMQLNGPITVLTGMHKGELFTLREYSTTSCIVSERQVAFHEFPTEQLVMLANRE